MFYVFLGTFFSDLRNHRWLILFFYVLSNSAADWQRGNVSLRLKRFLKGHLKQAKDWKKQKFFAMMKNILILFGGKRFVLGLSSVMLMHMWLNICFLMLSFCCSEDADVQETIFCPAHPTTLLFKFIRFGHQLEEWKVNSVWCFVHVMGRILCLMVFHDIDTLLGCMSF